MFLSDQDLGFLIVIAGMALWVFIVTKRPSEKTLEKRRRKEKLKKEHELEMLKLNLEKEKLKDGRGKVFKARRD